MLVHGVRIGAHVEGPRWIVRIACLLGLRAVPHCKDCAEARWHQHERDRGERSGVNLIPPA